MLWIMNYALIIRCKIIWKQFTIILKCIFYRVILYIWNFVNIVDFLHFSSSSSIYYISLIITINYCNLSEFIFYVNSIFIFLSHQIFNKINSWRNFLVVIDNFLRYKFTFFLFPKNVLRFFISFLQLFKLRMAHLIKLLKLLCFIKILLLALFNTLKFRDRSCKFNTIKIFFICYLWI
jgi:hypothetical protein